MAECKPTEKNDNLTRDLDLSSISTILKLILAAFNMYQKPAQSLPPQITLLGKNIKPGMSPRNLWARQSVSREEIGIPQGNVFKDGPNKDVQAMLSDRKEEVQELYKAKISGVSDVGSIMCTITGTAGVIPLAGTATNTLPVFSGSIIEA